MTKSVWWRFAYKSVVERANVKLGEVFTIITDDRVNPEIAEALFTVGVSQTEHTQVLKIRSYHYSEEPVNLNPAVVEIMKNSNVIITVCQTRIGQTTACREALAAGARILLTEPEHRETFLLDGLLNVDYDAMLQNARFFSDIMRERKHCKITSASGTDLEFSIGERPVIVSPGGVSKPGEMDWYPGAMSNVAPIEETIFGTVAVDGSLFPYGLVEETPVFLDIERGVIKNIRGGRLARRFEKWLKSLNDPVAYRFCHFSVGFNPQAAIRGAIMEDERCLGAVTIGFGRQPKDLKGAIQGGEHHLDVILKPPTISIGGQAIIDQGIFNENLGFLNMT